MVNAKTDIKHSVLAILETNMRPVSGNEIGERLGISRVAVWKHIKGLVEEGYTITSGRTGYTLLVKPDHVTSSGFDQTRDAVVVQETAESTMDMAKNCKKSGIAFFIAGNQRQGRGREGKEWASPGGGLYLTMVFTPKLPSAYANLYVIDAGLAIAEYINRHFHTEAWFKWPNDLYLGNRKLGGLLLEVEGETTKLSTCRLGFGINIDPLNRTDYPFAAAASLAEESSSPAGKPTINKVFSLLKPVLENTALLSAPESIVTRWESMSEDIGTSIILGKKGYIIAGMNMAGSLILEESSGELWEASAGWNLAGPLRHF